MLSIIIMILKIIGILILTLLALLAMALCLVLFVPVRYQAHAEIDGGLRAEGSVTWFLHVLNVTGGYGTGGFRISARLFGKELLHRPAEEGQASEPDGDEDVVLNDRSDIGGEIQDRISDIDEKDQAETRILNGKDRTETPGLVENPQNEMADMDRGNMDEMPNMEGDIRDRTPVMDEGIRDETPDRKEENRDEIFDIDGKIRDKTSDMDGKHSDEENEESRRTLFDRIRNVFRSIQRIFYNIQNFSRFMRIKLRQIRNSFQNLQEKIGRLKERIDRWVRLWNAEQTGQARHHLWKNIRYLCRHYLPRKLEGRIRLGLEDPAATGQALGILYILSAVTGNRLEVEGEFQEQVLEGELHLKGHIRACHFLMAALGLLADKNIRLTFRRVQRLRQGSLG